MNSDLSREEALKKIGDLIKDIKYAMLSTITTDGHIHSRPMTTQQADEFDGTLWFFASKTHGLQADVSVIREVNLAYANPEKNTYVSICGTASLVDDQNKKQELWKPVYKAWFPEGVNDPDMVLLKVNAHSAQYWDTPSSLAYALNLAKSIFTGNKQELGDSQKLSFNH